jgi:hypothetical protein
MKYTLLELIQRVLSSIKGEEVNSYSDTAESLVVRDIIKECYYNIRSTMNLPEHYTMFELTASGDNNLPVYMTIPDDILAVEWIKYNDEPISYMPPKQFYETQKLLLTTNSNVGTMSVTFGSSDTINFKYENDRDPKVYTSFEDNILIFDAFDTDAESTLQKANTACYGIRVDDWADDDSYTPDLDSQQFQLLLKEAKTMAFLELRQTTNAMALKEARKLRIRSEDMKWRANYGKSGYYNNSLPNYGRK